MSSAVFSAVVAMAVAVILGVATAGAASPPVVSSVTVSEVSQSHAHLSATVDPGGAEGQVSFEYSTDGVSWSGDYAGNLPGGSGPTTIEKTTTGLQPNTTYSVRAVFFSYETFENTYSEQPYSEFTTLAASAPTVTLADPSSVTATTAQFEGTINPGGIDPAFAVDWHFECTPECPGLNGHIDADSSNHQVSAEAAGLIPGTTYEVTLVATNGGGQESAGPKSFQTAPAPPEVGPAPTIAMPSSAIIAGDVLPNGSATTYHFEWGAADCATSSCTSTPETEAGAGGAPVYVSQRIEGLQLGATYHYRLVATSPEGTAVGPDRTFETVAAGQLPDGRRYEQVSPVDKHHSDIWRQGFFAAASGNALAYRSQGSFAGQPTSQSASLSYYRSVRTPSGWITEGINPPGGKLNFQAGYAAYSPELDKGIVDFNDSSDAPLVPGAKQGMNFYLTDFASKTHTLLNGTMAPLTSSGGFNGASADFSQILFQSPEALTPDAPCDGVFIFNVCTYEWDHGTLRLASIAPDGSPISGVGGTGASGNYPFGSIQHAMSEDGSRYYFTGVAGPSNGALYMRENHSTTLKVNVPERTSGTVANEGAGANFQVGEAAHGERAVFNTTEALVNADNDESYDLYLWDRTKPEGERLTLISEDRNSNAPDGAEVLTGYQHLGGVVGASANLDRVYFVAANQIVPGAPNGPGPKLYLWDDTGPEPEISYVATLSSQDERAWQGPWATGNMIKPAHTTADGRLLAIDSHADLTGFHSDGEAQIYLYDAADGSIECASCSPDALPEKGYLAFDESETQGDGTIPPVRQLRGISENGQVFFETKRGLVPQDSNGRIDVYEADHGQLRLISRGTGDTDSHFEEADVSGDNVFFITGDRLVGWDNDANVDAYDARVGGGFPEPPPTPAPCEGDACQPPPVVPNDPTPGSSGFKGPESPTPRFKKHRGCKRHHGKKRCAKKHGKKHSTRKHG